MPTNRDDIRDFLNRRKQAVLVEVEAADGSTPREAGAWMLVAADCIFGTIGGGQLEFMAIDHARRALESGAQMNEMNDPARSGDWPMLRWPRLIGLQAG